MRKEKERKDNFHKTSIEGDAQILSKRERCFKTILIYAWLQSEHISE